MIQTSMMTTGDEDVIERGIRRVLPVKLTREELTDIAIRRATAEAERDGMAADLDREKKRRAALIEERDNEIEKMGRELRTGEQDRTVPCTRVFRRDLDGSGWVVTIRQDTLEEVTREPATPAQLQRYLPGVEPEPTPEERGGRASRRSVLDEAREAQAAAAPIVVDDDDDDDDDDDPSADYPVDGSGDDGFDEQAADTPPEEGDGEDRATPTKPKARSAGKAKADGHGDGTFAVDDIVTWVSQAAGTAKRKTGKVDCVVPVGKTPRSLDERYKKFSTARQHVSYIVDVDGELYWPVVSQLKLQKGK